MSQRDYREAWEANEASGFSPEQRVRAERLLRDAYKAHRLRTGREEGRIGVRRAARRPSRGYRPDPAVLPLTQVFGWVVFAAILGLLGGVALCRWLLEVGG